MQLIVDNTNPNTSCTADGIEKSSSYEFMNPYNQLETINFTFPMNDVVKQKDEKCKNILSLMRNGTLMN